MSRPVAFITGGAKRIGAATANTLHQAGYNLVLHYHLSSKKAQALADHLNQQRADSVKLVRGDLCELSQLQAIGESALAAFGRIDALINNASSFFPTPVGTITAADWHSLVGSNMQAPLFLSQQLTPALQQQRGVIINMVDIHAEKPLKNHTVYCMAKAGLVAMTKSLAQELAPDIRVNGVAPGAILWPENELNEAEKQDVLALIPAGRLGDVGDIAGAIAYLIQADYVTGQILAVDGGRSIATPGKA